MLLKTFPLNNDEKFINVSGDILKVGRRSLYQTTSGQNINTTVQCSA